VRRRRRAESRTAPGPIERLLFTFLGPPQLGDLNAPVTARSDPAADLCPRCGRPWDAHEVVRTSTRTYLTCPPGQDMTDP